MPSESPERRPVAVTLPPSLEEWLAERAEETGVDRGELLVQLAASYRAAADGDPAAELASAVEEAATEAATERVDDRLGSFRSSLDSQLQEIRKRVVQLKRESDEKAPSTRVAELSTRVDGLDERLDELEQSVRTLRTDVEELPGAGAGEPGSERAARSQGRDRAAADPGLIERVEDVESKLVRVARAVVDLHERDAATAATGEDADRAGADLDHGVSGRATLRGIRRVAAREGVREAPCSGCGETVDLTLLPEADCPHCGARFADLALAPATGEPRLALAEDGADADATGLGGDANAAVGEGTEPAATGAGADPDAGAGADDR
ncbi:MAG: hypothetical protein V5A85_11045 [Haloarculaceae archaeon]